VAIARVTVGLPIFNGARFLEHALSSVLSQTYEDLELVISDNACTDETEEPCRAACHRDSWVRYYRNGRNLGAAPNYNLLVGHARGEYFK
jgi:glycosyltransferase involved in cell wall biosynthesis